MPETPEERYKRIHAIRKKAKVVTYSALYGVGKVKLARSTGMTEAEAEKLLEAFWRINWAVQKVAGSSKKKLALGQTWIKNPVSGFWHSLRYDKDSWSTLNQSTGVYCFDTWLAFCRAYGSVISAQFHDEQLAPVKIGQEARTRELFKKAIVKVNEKLKLNIDLDVDVQFGGDYAQVH